MDGYVVALGRRLPGNKLTHNTLRAGPLDLTGIIPTAMAEFIAKHLRDR